MSAANKGYKASGQKDRQPVSLQETMNQLARAPAGSDAASHKSIHTELDAFLATDPLLATLSKQARNAQAYYERLVRTHGAQDPMTEVAADMADSARCAYETRLIELRADGETQAAAQALLKEAERARKAVKAERSAWHKLRMLTYTNDRDMTRARLAKEKAESSDLLFLTYWVFYNALFRAHRAYNLMSAFEQASLRQSAHQAA